MKTHIGAVSPDQARTLLELGADEVYCGLASIPSHRGSALNFRSPREILEVAGIAHALGRRTFLAVNEIYPERSYGSILRCVEQLVAGGLDGIIARDTALLDFFRDRGLHAYVILSSLALCFNSESLRFYKERGVSRVTLPQHLMPEEARSMVDNRLGIEAEIFFHARSYCINVDGACLLHYSKSRARLRDLSREQFPCLLAYQCGGQIFSMPMPTFLSLLRLTYRFAKMGVRYIKLGRHSDTARQANHLREIVLLSRLLDSGLSEAEFISSCSAMLGSQRALLAGSKCNVPSH